MPTDAVFAVSSSIMLSCVRCRSKKLRCDKSRPQCERCRAADVYCGYPMRKRRRSNRMLHERPHGAASSPLLSQVKGHPAPGPAVNVDDRTSTSENPCVEQSSQGVLEDVADGPGGSDGIWVYQMVSGAKDSIPLNTASQTVLSNGSSAPQTAITDAIHDLNNALTMLKTEKPKLDIELTGGPDTIAPRHDLERYIQVFIKISPYIMVDRFSSFIDPKILMAMPYLMNSPYVHLDPALYVIYYNAIYFGQSCGTLLEQKASSRTYYMCLQAAMAWLNSARGTELDLLAAASTTWSAVNNFDYHVSWRLHREACRFAKILGLHEISDPLFATSNKTTEGERCFYLHLTATDLMFRLWYDKPSALPSSISERNLSTSLEYISRGAKASVCIINIVWGRAITILLDFFTTDDNDPIEEGSECEERTDRCCKAIEELLEDWDLISMTKVMKMDEIGTWMYAECIIACYSFIICMRRKAGNESTSIHPQALKAARLVITVIGEYSGRSDPLGGEHNYFHLLFVTFYPFCAFFTLYQYIIASPPIDDHEHDLSLLEKVVNGMTGISATRADFIPIANAMSALNKVCRAVYSSSLQRSILHAGGQKERTSQEGRIEHYPVENHNPSFSKEVARHLRTFSSEAKYSHCTDVPYIAQNSEPVFNGLVKPNPSHIAADGTLNPQMPEGEQFISAFEPLDVVRAIENEFAWSNWNDNWWNSSIGWDGGDRVNSSQSGGPS